MAVAAAVSLLREEEEEKEGERKKVGLSDHQWKAVSEQRGRLSTSQQPCEINRKINIPADSF